MSEALPIPTQPDLEYYKKLAKDLLKTGQGPTPVQEKWARFKETRTPVKLTDAQFFLAHAHGFASWPKFANHVQALARSSSQVAGFEAAADAIVGGDLAGLTELLASDPALATARSTREHRSTLLHYVSANGVEDFRQKTPANIVAIATCLLDAGADVNAKSEAYGGNSDTLLLTATSVHPEKAGVQTALMELLIARGALLGSPRLVTDSLRNGRGRAAEFLVERGAAVDFEGAAGVGLVDIASQLYAEATPRQRVDGFHWACEFGRGSVVEMLLERGVEVNETIGLHWAAYGGHSNIVQRLLAGGADPQAKDERFSGTALDWARHAAGEGGARDEVIALLRGASSPPL